MIFLSNDSNIAVKAGCFLIYVTATAAAESCDGYYNMVTDNYMVFIVLINVLIVGIVNSSGTDTG